MDRRVVASLAFAALLAACSSDPYADLVQPKDAVTLPSGLAYKVLKAGDESAHPALSNQVTVNYTLWQPPAPKSDATATDNLNITPTFKKLESTTDDKGVSSPATFPLGKLIKGWQQMIPLMSPGERVRVWIPADLAYGEHPTRADHPPAGPLIFEIELVAIGQ
ncbi:MAG TPA: FKBP-type peptidyl-prolyl cis-trans isomerase [Gammaproteobacteria bacterium]|nr:FKBP-type peptidyl-prolyl cis-trans isomerase [Gammaproteobacteria bacterium]